MNIIFNKIIEFILNDNCYISYNIQKNEWTVNHIDEDVSPNNIIIPENLQHNLYPFDNCIITVKMFEQFKKIVAKELKNK